MIKFKAVKERETKHSQRYEEIVEDGCLINCKIVYIRKTALIKAYSRFPEELWITIEEVVNTPF